MSRTDKDMPAWVTATWWKPVHRRCRYSYLRRPGRVCDLPPEPVRKPIREVKWQYNEPGCHWRPILETRRWYDVPPDWFVDHVWRGPQRRQVRDDCRLAVKEHRATGQVDVIPTVDQHRHGATWLWT